jgi:hypothetical protein
VAATTSGSNRLSTEENHEYLSQDSRCPGRDSNSSLLQHMRRADFLLLVGRY